MTELFKCCECGTYYLQTRNPCCPDIWRGIINSGPLEEMRPNWKTRVKGWGMELDELQLDPEWLSRTFAQTTLGKFFPEAENPSNRKPYESAITWSGIQQGAVLDFGCCMGHGAAVFREYSPKCTYIGVDCEPLFLTIGSVIWSPQHLYLTRKREDREQPLKHIDDNSIDLLIASFLTGYDNCSEFMAEWLRVTKPDAFLYYGTHDTDAFICKDAVVPTDQDRKVIGRWLEENTEPIRLECSIEDFVSGRSRMVGLFRMVDRSSAWYQSVFR